MDVQAMKPEQAAQLLGVSRTTVYELLRSGELRSLRIGRSRRVTPRALEDFVALREGAGAVRAE